jgi:hypothetical protein
VHGGHLPVASETLRSTLYLSDERRRSNPTAVDRNETTDETADDDTDTDQAAA